MSEIPSRSCSTQEGGEQSRTVPNRAALAEPITPPSKSLRPHACRTHIRRHLAAAWPTIVTKLVTKAEEGSVSHTNLAAKLAGFDFRPGTHQKPKRREKSFAKQLLQEIDELEEKNVAEFGPL